jgi:uncharacterized protein YjbJ (UPF0337 family)
MPKPQKTPMKKEIIKGNWDIAKGKLKRAYSKVSDNDLWSLEGMEDEFFGRLEKATGATRAELERFFADSPNHG